MSVCARAVSWRTSMTRATCHSSRAGGASGIALIPLLTPRIPAIVIAELLPKPRLIARHEPKATHPLRALPEIEMRHEQPRGPAMLRRQRRAPESERDPSLAIAHIVERQVGRVSTVAERHHESAHGEAASPRRLEERVDGYAFPLRVELGPLRHAVDVHRRQVVWKCL